MHTHLRSASSHSLLAALCGSLLFAAPMLLAQSAPASSSSNLASQQSPFGGQVVEDIIARVNDQIITSSDYNRALQEMDQDARQHGETMQQIAEAHKDLLRNLIDQQLWLSKGKELGITGETELVKQLDEIRKKYNLATMEDLEKAAQQQGVSFEDFKANLRDQIITQDVMRQEVGSKVNVTPGEAYRYYQEHQQDFTHPESVHLAEILVSTAPAAGAAPSSESARLALAKAKADDIEAKLKAGANFDQLARTESDGSTAAEGGDLGKYERGSLAKVLEDATFNLKAGQFTQPILTRQGYVILKVLEHDPGGVAPFKQVEGQVEQAYFMSKMQPAIRQYLTKMREEAYIDIRPGYTDTGASPLETKPIYSAYTPPSPKKKKKVERARYRETDHGFRAKGEPKPLALTPASLDTSKPAATPAAQPSTGKHHKKKKKEEKPRVLTSGKKEKIRFGQAPMETLPDTPRTKQEDAGAVQDNGNLQTADVSNEPANPLDQAPVRRQKTRFSDRARTESKTPKKKKSKKDAFFNQAEDQYAPAPPDPTEVANQQLQSAPLGLNGDTSKNKKKKHSKKVEVVGQPKTRLQDSKEKKAPKQPLEYTPAGPVTGAPAPRATSESTTTGSSSGASQQPQ